MLSPSYGPPFTNRWANAGSLHPAGCALPTRIGKGPGPNFVWRSRRTRCEICATEAVEPASRMCFLAPAIVKSNFLRYNAQVNSFAQPSSGRLLGWPPRSSSACLALRSFFKCLPGREAALYPDANGGGAVFVLVCSPGGRSLGGKPGWGGFSPAWGEAPIEAAWG